MKTVLVTGGAGFVGSHLCERLLAAGDKVISLDNYFAGSKDNHIPGVEYRDGHTKHIDELIPESVDLVYHLGEYSRVEQSVLEPEVVHDLNIVGTEAVLKFWAKRGCKLVYAGSSTKFGDDGKSRYTSPYASTKAENTEKVKEEGDRLNLPYAITYFYNVYGPGERAGLYGTVIEAFKQMYLQGAPFAITAPGTQQRNFTHVDDIVDGLLLVGERGLGDEFGLGNQRAFAILDVARMFGADIVMLPARSSSRMTSALDTAKAASLGWSTKRSLERYIGDFVKNNPMGEKKEKRVLVFSTTFFPVAGPAEHALLELVKQVPDVQFDVITSAIGSAADVPKLPNVAVYRVGFRSAFDKYLLPILGYKKALQLSKKHSYLFSWALMASYAALAGAWLKNSRPIPLLVTLADQNFTNISDLKRRTLAFILRNADQSYGIDTTQEAHAADIIGAPLLRKSLGAGDAFANQLRYAYADLLRQPSHSHNKRVLILSLAYYPRQVGGAEVAIKEISDRIPEIEFDMVCLRFDSTLPRQEKIGNVTVHRIGWGAEKPSPKAMRSLKYRFLKLWFQFAAARHANMLHKKNQYDALWSMMAHSCGVPGALFKMMNPSVPFILTLQEGDPPEHIERVMLPLWPFFKRAFTKADIVQVISTFLGDWARRRGFKGPLEVVPNGVSVKHFSQDYPAAVINEIKDTLAKKMGDVFLITTSRLVHKNAVDDVIRALPHIPANVKFIVLGIGPDEEALKSLAKKLNVEDRVQFLGEVQREEMPKYLQASDIFIRPSRSEGMGISFVEAMAAGLPIIATQEGGIADFLFDERRNPDKPVTGWAVDKNSPEQIAEAVRDIMSRPEKMRAVVATARETVAGTYDWDTIADSMRKRVFEKAFMK